MRTIRRLQSSVRTVLNGYRLCNAKHACAPVDRNHLTVILYRAHIALHTLPHVTHIDKRNTTVRTCRIFWYTLAEFDSGRHATTNLARAIHTPVVATGAPFLTLQNLLKLR